MGALMKRGFTLMEMVVVVVITAILSVASFKAISMLVIKSFKAKEQTRLSLESQIALDQLSSLLQYRIPASAIGYDPGSGDFVSLSDIQSGSRYKILEWISRAFDDYRAGRYSGFVDMVPTVRSDDILATKTSLSGSGYNLVFAGSYDKAFTLIEDFKNAFGWHGHESQKSYDIEFVSNGIRIIDSQKPREVYEKYYLADQAFGVAIGADIDRGADCIKALHLKDIDNTLLLFFGYRPWHGETFCADPNGAKKSGQVSVLAKNIGGFMAKEQDYTLRLLLDINESLKGGGILHFSKMKVVF